MAKWNGYRWRYTRPEMWVRRICMFASIEWHEFEGSPISLRNAWFTACCVWSERDLIEAQR